ncbi:Helix-turn-helix domain-containing protein [Pedobacter westerhofensis]|uniref:Helix-turn-helix domain-containing protein n=1 Tax=Pedobacter westerhofensis TaxID=425512 RepID=A0A521CSW7_9SPHI|nr:helix-turn-helix domain-containing protein [Pedobacter westerhofensis]SMO62563.1 Helix-turn-helix domain-containing protein [Pedobacter westerhofensis]
MNNITRIKTISEWHRTRDLPAPEHPLISIVDYAAVHMLPEFRQQSWVFDFYFISLKRNMGGMIRYGQQEYDFDEGVMFFIAPGQVFSIEKDPVEPPDRSGWIMLIHPDFLWNSALSKSIKQYDFFDYSINEALFVSNKEEIMMQGILANIRNEYHANIDAYSQNIIVSQIETLLSYSDRFYNRQFITRKKANHKVLDTIEELLSDYFSSADLFTKGLPTVNHLAEQLNISPKYMSRLLKVLTGQTAQQHIHEKLLDKAKEKLTVSDLSVSEIAYDLGFEHPQSFSKLFKTKTGLSPLEFRQSFRKN